MNQKVWILMRYYHFIFSSISEVMFGLYFFGVSLVYI